MGILFESSTPIEFLLKEALIKENFSFYEQYRIGTGGRFSTVKYVADFLIIYKNIRLIVECDGRTYHSNSSQKRNQIERDAWLIKRCYKILHFSTEEIKYKMPFVINTIKYTLGIIDRIPIYKKSNNLRFDERYLQSEYTVALFCYYQQLPKGVCVTYIYEDKTRNIFSEIRQKRCADIVSDMAETIAIYLALLDLKRNVNVHVFYAGQVFNDHFDVNKKIRSKLTLLKNGTDLLKEHKLLFTHINSYAKPSKLRLKEYKIMDRLKKKSLNSCKEILNGKEFVGCAYESLLCDTRENSFEY